MRRHTTTMQIAQVRLFARSFTVLLAAGMLAGSQAFAQTNFKVSSGPWNDNGSWTNGVPSDSNGVATIANGGTATYDSSMGTMSFGSGNEFHIGNGGAGNTINTLDITGGTLIHDGGETLVGFGLGSPVTGYLNVSGGTFDNQSNPSNPTNVLTVGWLGATGYVNISGGGQVDTVELRVGSGPGGTGHLDIAASGGFFTSSGLLSVGFDSASGGYLTQEGGTLTSNGELVVGNGALGHLTLSGGQINANSDFVLGANYNGNDGSGLVVQNGGTVTANYFLNVGQVGSSSTYELNGGTLQVQHIVADSAGTLDLNGGILQAHGNDGGFIESNGGLAVHVQSGGAIIDSNTFSITINKSLVEDGSSPGGGLTKIGAGTLTLAATNTYTGNTTVDLGTLEVTGSLLNNGSNNVHVVAGTDFTTASVVRRVQPAGSYAGLGSTAIGTAIGLLGSQADLRAGQNNNLVANDVSMAWRVRTTSEQTAGEGGSPTSPPLPTARSTGLISDVLDIMGMDMTGGQSAGARVETDPFTLQMTYDPTKIPAGKSEGAYIQSGALTLDWLNTDIDGPTGLWQLATTGDFGQGADAVSNYQGSWDSFVTAHAGLTDATLGLYLGSYGEDAVTHTAWAVVNHNSEFAVAVPEPGSIEMAVLGLVGLIGCAVRCRRAAAQVNVVLAPY